MPVIGVAPSGNIAQTISALQGIEARRKSSQEALAQQKAQGVLGAAVGGASLAARLGGDYLKQQATQELAKQQMEATRLYRSLQLGIEPGAGAPAPGGTAGPGAFQALGNLGLGPSLPDPSPGEVSIAERLRQLAPASEQPAGAMTETSSPGSGAGFTTRGQRAEERQRLEKKLEERQSAQMRDYLRAKGYDEIVLAAMDGAMLRAEVLKGMPLGPAAASTELVKNIRLEEDAKQGALLKAYNIDERLPLDQRQEAIRKRQEAIGDAESDLKRLVASVPQKQYWADRAMQEVKEQGSSTALEMMKAEHEIRLWGGRLSGGRETDELVDSQGRNLFVPGHGGMPGGWMSQERLGKYVKAKDYEALGSLAALWIAQLPETHRAVGLRYFHDQLEAAGANMQEFYRTGLSEIPERSVTGHRMHQERDEKYRSWIAEAIALTEQANKRRGRRGDGGREYTGGTLPALSEGFSQHFSGGLPSQLSRPWGRILGQEPGRVQSFEEAADQQRLEHHAFADSIGPRWIDPDLLNELMELRRKYPHMSKPRED